jgi:hypothetical protein
MNTVKSVSAAKREPYVLIFTRDTVDHTVERKAQEYGYFIRETKRCELAIFGTKGGLIRLLQSVGNKCMPYFKSLKHASEKDFSLCLSSKIPKNLKDKHLSTDGVKKLTKNEVIELFKKHEREEFLYSERMNVKFHWRPDLNGLLLLESLGYYSNIDRKNPIDFFGEVTDYGILLRISVEDTLEEITEAIIIELLRSGINYSKGEDSFVLVKI